MPGKTVSVVIPTLTADHRLRECLEGLAQQTRRDFEVLIVDNSGTGLVRLCDKRLLENSGVPVIILEQERNLGFGTAINLAARRSAAPYLVTLNDDAIPRAGWLEALVGAAEADPKVGMCASQVRLASGGELDSAGMLLCGDGSSKQRGHGQAPEFFAASGPALLPSGSAALYRRAMFDALGGFDDDFFLYCEDTDLGLRACWAGWTCQYVAEAVVDHYYSHSAGQASPLKAFYVERNRLSTLVKNFPLRMLVAAPFISAARYLWHVWYILRGRGTGARFRQEGNSGARMAWFVLKAHLALLGNFAALLRKRRAVQRRIGVAEFRALVKAHSIGARKVAEL